MFQDACFDILTINVAQMSRRFATRYVLKECCLFLLCC